MSRRDKALSIILMIALLGAIGATGYVVANPRPGERFTEFYILGSQGKATDYPRELMVGEVGGVTIGIVNREDETVSYRVEVRIDGIKDNEVVPIVLKHNEKWEKIVNFTPHKVGDNQKIEFLLFKNEEVEPCLESLYLRLDITR